MAAINLTLLHLGPVDEHGFSPATMRIAAGWPWPNDLITGFQRLAELPEPVT
ncbi:hypothetical protein ACQP2Y_12670 [Actinoplanes sp. CA-051413]|uniref:hypothetical protein n=1 Tax=Actinoplanes sp. CA-051413 TaxID=3239899 RepID=UPI003D980FF0